MNQATLRIFISSPGDVANEREKARHVVARLQKQFHSVQLEPLLWEDLALPATASFQETIDYLLTSQPIDVAVFILWSRLGSPLGPASTHPDGTPYRSGTEREFDLMLEAFEQSGRRRPVILAYARGDEEGFLKLLNTAPRDRWIELIEQRNLAESFVRENFQDTQGRNLRAYHSYQEPISFAQRLQVHLREILNELVSGEAAPRWLEAPYRGLEFFDLEHAAIFQGRDDETFDVLQRLRDRDRDGCAFVVIVGASGSGKSSLARAGVAATLSQQAYDDNIGEWRIAKFVPGLASRGLLRHLIDSLAEQLPELSGSDEEREKLAECLTTNASLSIQLSIEPAFARAGERAGGAVRLLLILDQMEELWTDDRFSVSDRERLLEVLEALARSGCVAVLATLRSDFYPHAQALPVFLRLKGDRGHLDLLPPGPAALQRLISEPARLAGLEFERNRETGQKLDEVIAQDAARDPTSLPLLEYALSELYQRRDDQEHLLTFAAYEQMGRVEGTLGRRASEIFQQLPEHVRSVLPEILSLLITVDAIGEQTAVRRRSDLAELNSTPDRKALTESLIAARFLTTDRIGEAVATLAHEALLRKWREVTEWIDANRELLRLRSRVEQAQARWNGEHRHPSLLLPPGLPLEEGRKLLSSGWLLLSAETAEYIRQSVQHQAANIVRQRRNRRYLLVGLSCLALFTSVAAFFAWFQRQESVALANDKARLAKKMEEAAETATALAADKTRLAAAAEEARNKADASAETAQKLASEKERIAQQEQEARADAEEKKRAVETEFARAESERARAETERARADAGRYQVQLARISYLGQDDPEQAMQLLQSSEDCPRELRDFTWSLLFAQAIDFPTREHRVVELKQASSVNAITYSPDGRLLAAGHADGAISLCNAANLEPLATLRQHSGPVLSLAFSPDGKTLISGGQDSHVHVWDVLQRMLRRTLTGHTAPVVAVYVSSDGTLILSGAGDLERPAAPDVLQVAPPDASPGELILWSTETGKRDNRRHLPRGGVRCAAFQPQSSWIVIGRNGETERCDINTGETEPWPPRGRLDRVDIAVNDPIPFEIDCVAFSGDSSRFCAAAHRIQDQQKMHSLQQSRLKLYGSPRREKDDRQPPALPALNPPLLPHDAATQPPVPVEINESSLPPLVSLPALEWTDLDRPARVTSDKPASAMFGHPRRILCVTFSPDGRTLATGDSEGHIQLRDPVTGGIRLTLRAHQGPVQSLAFAPDGAALSSASGGESGKIMIHRGLPTEAKVLAEKAGRWSFLADLTQSAYEAGAILGTFENVEFAALQLAFAEAELAWSAEMPELAVRRMTEAAQHAERYADALRQRNEFGIISLGELSSALELRGRTRLAALRLRHAQSRPLQKLSDVKDSRLPILRQITGGLPAGAASRNELEILKERAGVFEKLFRRNQARYEAGAASATAAYDAATRFECAQAAVRWAEGDSATAVDQLRVAVEFLEYSSELHWVSAEQATIQLSSNWSTLSEFSDVKLALAKIERNGSGESLLPDLNDIVDRAEIEITLNPNAEELDILDETMQSMQDVQHKAELLLKTGHLSPLDGKLIDCRVLVAKADRAWAAGNAQQASRFLADAMVEATEARSAAEAMNETDYPSGDRVYADTILKLLEIKLAFERLNRPQE